jgi:hypothetical protein
MWISHNSPTNIKLEAYFDTKHDIEKVQLWNYNGKDLSKGVKLIEVYKKNVLSWKGVIAKGSHTVKDDYCTKITLNEEFVAETVYDSIDYDKNKHSGQETTNEDYLRTSLNSTINKYMKNSGTFLKNSTRNIDYEYDTQECIHENYVTFNRMKIVFTSNYGNFDYVGITGIQFLDEKGKPISIENAISIGALPKDINTVNNNFGDPRIFENIFNSLNEVTDDYYMWLTVFEAYSPPYLEIVFDKPLNLSGIQIWNYNKPDELDKGVRSIEVILNEDYSHTYSAILRKGLGEESMDYSQTITFPMITPSMSEEELEPFKVITPASLIYHQDFDTPYLPSGFHVKLDLLTTHGDGNDIGFDRLEFYNQLGQLIPFDHVRVFTNTDATVDPIAKNEPWTCNYINTKKYQNPMENTFSNFYPRNGNLKMNKLYFLFDKPISLSYIQIWNYSDNPEKGIKDIQIFVDDCVVYKGVIKKSSDSPSTVILFTSDNGVTKNLDERLLNTMEKNIYKEIENDNEVRPFI